MRMVVDEVLKLDTSSESNDVIFLDSNSNIRNNANVPQAVLNDNGNDIFNVEDIGQDAHCETSLQSPIQSLELAESKSGSIVLNMENFQANNNCLNGSLVGENEELLSDKIDVGSKRPEDEINKKESSVRVVYNFLPSRSKRKLEELLHQWSEWHAQQFKSVEDPADCLESGEETYFPALRVGSEKSSAVSFSMDVHVRKRQRTESLPLYNNCSTLYDRGYSVGLATEEGTTEERVVDLREAPRCFNCGSYNHALNECQKPFNNSAVRSARQQFLTKKNQNTGPRVQTRYYQESPGGKFDGLKPGALSCETKKLLGLGELDPPPWLNRMRELGYPPGYFDQEDQPSGIAIFDDNLDSKNELPLDAAKSQRKTTVKFPGINAPIPENADQKSWTAPLASAPDYSWNQNQPNYGWDDSINNGNFRGPYGSRNHVEPPLSHFGLGLSPPVPHDRHNYYPRDPFSPRGVPVPGSPRYGRPDYAGRPFTYHYNYGSL